MARVGSLPRVGRDAAKWCWQAGRRTEADFPLLIGRRRHPHHPPKPSAESRDLEDLIAVVEGRATLVTEVQAETVELRAYVRAEINRLLAKARSPDLAR
jgi:hypothetical protein